MRLPNIINIVLLVLLFVCCSKETINKKDVYPIKFNLNELEFNTSRVYKINSDTLEALTTHKNLMDFDSALQVVLNHGIDSNYYPISKILLLNDSTASFIVNNTDSLICNYKIVDYNIIFELSVVTSLSDWKLMTNNTIEYIKLPILSYAYFIYDSTLNVRSMKSEITGYSFSDDNNIVVDSLMKKSVVPIGDTIIINRSWYRYE